MVVFFDCHLLWSLSLSSQASHSLSSPFSSTGSFVSTASMVSGVASSALWGGSDGSFLHGVFSVAPVPEDSVGVFSDPLTFPGSDDITLKSSSQSQGAFKQIVYFISVFFPKSCPRNGILPIRLLGSVIWR